MGQCGKIKAVFFDIDGTLVSFQSHTVPMSARRAIECLRTQGIKVFIATGRLMRHTEVVSDIEVDGYVTVNGSYCTTADGKIIFEKAFPREVVEKVWELERRYGFQSAVMTHENIFVSHIGERVRTIADMIAIEPEVADLKQVVATQPVLQMCPYIDADVEREIMPQLPECVASRWIKTFMDINLRGVDKSVGISRVMEYYGFTMSEAMAFGDGGNDIPMVRDAGIGVAMGNACDELKSVADYVTLSVDDDGVEWALKKFGLI